MHLSSAVFALGVSLLQSGFVPRSYSVPSFPFINYNICIYSYDYDEYVDGTLLAVFLHQ